MATWRRQRTRVIDSKNSLSKLNENLAIEEQWRLLSAVNLSQTPV